MPSMAWDIENTKNVKLFVATPKTPSFKYVHSVVDQSWKNTWQPRGTEWHLEYAHGVATAREKLADSFMASDCTHLLHLDGDIVLKQDTIHKMLVLGKPCVVGRYHEKSKNRFPEVFRHSQVPWARAGPIDFKVNEILEFPQSGGDVLLAGLGLVLVEREVFEKLSKPYYLYSSEHVDLDDYNLVSEDFYFMLKVQNEAKVKVTYAPDILVGHLGEAIVFDQNHVEFV